MAVLHWQQEMRMRTDPFERASMTEGSTATSPSVNWSWKKPHSDDGFEEPKEEKDDSNRCKRLNYIFCGFVYDFCQFCSAAWSKPYIWLSFLLVFALLTSSGIFTLHRMCVLRHERMMNEAMWHAIEIGECSHGVIYF